MDNTMEYVSINHFISANIHLWVYKVTNKFILAELTNIQVVPSSIIYKYDCI